MEDRKIDQLVEAISELTSSVTELAVKVKRLTNNNPFQNGYWKENKDKYGKI